MYMLHCWSTTRKMLNVAQFDFYVNGTSGGTFWCLHADVDNEMIPVWRKCMTRNKKSQLVTSHLTVLDFLYTADLLLFNGVCFATELKTVNVRI